MTDKQRRWYEDALTAYAAGNGQRWNRNLAGRLTTAAVACGLSTQTVLDDVAARMPNFRAEHAAQLQRDMATAERRQGTRSTPGEWKSRRQPERDGFPDFVRDLIAVGGGVASSRDLIARSPIPTAGLDGVRATELFLRTLWQPLDLLHVFSKLDYSGRMGANIRSRDEWLHSLEAGALPGDLIRKNPLTGRPSADGSGSLLRHDCVGKYRFALLEFDHLPLKTQCAFWLGFLATPNLAPCLASLTFSGGRSIHGLVRVHGDAARSGLAALFCADPTTATTTDADGATEAYFPYRADEATLGAGGGTRLAGARRIAPGKSSHGMMQSLLYLAGDQPRQPTRPKAEPPIIITSPPTAETPTEPAVTPPPPPAPEAQTAEPPTEPPPKIVRRCAGCDCADRCRVAFGRFWAAKSHGGEGCATPLK